MAAYTTIDDAGLFFNTLLYTGDGSTQSITGVGFQPDMNFVKSRAVQNWGCVDAIRGVGEAIHPNLTLAEGSAPDGLTAFNADGFSVGTDTTWNGSTVAYASYNWKAGTTTGIDTTGSTITPTSYSFNATAGQSIIAYTGNTTSGALVPHGLGALPKMIIVKSLDTADNWTVYMSALEGAAAGATKFLNLNEPDRDAVNTNRWNDTAPTTVLFSLGSGGETNGSGDFIAYCFTDIQGYSRFGNYQGNGNADGTFVYTGFRPAFVLLKRTAGTDRWTLHDDKRLGYNPDNELLATNNTAAEASGYIDIMSNGFKLTSSTTQVNNLDELNVYAAFASNPFVNSEGVAGNAR